RRVLGADVLELPAADEIVDALIDVRLDRLGARAPLQRERDLELLRAHRQRPGALRRVALDGQLAGERDRAQLRVVRGFDGDRVRAGDGGALQRALAGRV